MKLEVLLATMHKNRIAEIAHIIPNPPVPTLVVNQSSFIDDVTEGNIRMLSTTERGSSNSRNMALKNATGDICLIADDDIEYVVGVDKVVRQAYKSYPDADIITFQIQTPEGKPFNQGYPSVELVHNWRTIMRCASIEITFRLSSVLNAGLTFDQRFGLGSKYRVHDEVIFLKDALDRGLKAVYIPVPIVIHPAESSGTNYTEHLIASKGAAFVRMFGRKAYFFNLLFALKKRAEYKCSFSMPEFLKIMNEGSRKFLRERVR